MSELIIFKTAQETSSKFINENQIIPQHVRCIELDTGKIKVGNGINHYNDLPYSGTINSNILFDIYEYSNPIPDKTFTINPGDRFEFEVHAAHADNAALFDSTNRGQHAAISLYINEISTLNHYTNEFWRNSSSAQTVKPVVASLSPVIRLWSNIAVGVGNGVIARSGFINNPNIKNYQIFTTCDGLAHHDGVADYRENQIYHDNLGAPLNTLLKAGNPVQAFITFHPKFRGSFKLIKK